VSIAALEQDILAANRILLDSSALIAYLNGGEPTSPVITHIIDDFLRRGRNTAIVSMVTVMEVIVQPLRVSAPTGRHALNFLTRTPNMSPQPIDLHVAHRAARLRASYNFKTPDALVIATGLVHQVGVLVTNDRRWNVLQQSPGMQVKVCSLDRYLPFP
jgi:predicted nucleic acid-binding protein